MGDYNKLRPTTFEEYIGQEPVKAGLKVAIEAAQKRGEPLEHILFYGPAGLGKTTLATVIANELDVPIVHTTAPAINQKKDLAAILTSLEEDGTVLFVDEIHRLHKAIEEMLYSAMEDFVLHIMIGEGAGARPIKISLPRFTLIGATTRAGRISAPLRDRFGMIFKLEFYSVQEIMNILYRSAEIINVNITEGGAKIIAERAKGIPRIANRLLNRVRDYAQLHNNNIVDEQIALRAFKQMEIDELGLNREDRTYLLTLIHKFDGGPVGIDSLSTALNEEKDTVEDLIEPYLIRIGLIKRTQKGRIATVNSYKYLGITRSGQGELFDE